MDSSESGVTGELLATDLDEARRYLPSGSEQECAAFAARQVRARMRLDQLRRFYRAHPCRMARVHLLTGCAITLGRFAGLSPIYEAIGEALMPCTPALEPRSEAWRAYAAACSAHRAWELREELWIEAHSLDLDGVRRAGLDLEFESEAKAHAGDPTWQLLVRHMELTLNARLIDRSALDGLIAYETAISHGMAVSLGRMLRTGGTLLAHYALQAAWALLAPARERTRPIGSYRRVALDLIRYALTAWTAATVYRRGIRQRERGSRAQDEGWPLLDLALGARVREVDPMVVRFYTNPAHFAARASLDLHTAPARLWSFVATLLIGQGLYEADAGELDARFRVFKRRDGSMHFVRELYAGGALRVFDSDFVVRVVDGVPRLFEVFVDEKIDVEMDLRPLEGGGLSIRSRRITMRGLRMPKLGLEVEFISRVDDGVLRIDGHLRMEPKTALGRFFVFKLLRRPVELGCIHYVARPSSPS